MGMHACRVEVASFTGHRKIDGLIDVADAGQGEHGHHLLCPHEGVIVGDLDKHGSNLGTGGDAEFLQNEVGGFAHEVFVDGGMSSGAGVFLEDDLFEASQVSRGDFDRTVAFHGSFQGFGHGFNDNAFFFVDTDHVVVEGMAENDVFSGLFDIGGGVDDDGWVAGAGANRAFS